MLISQVNKTRVFNWNELVQAELNEILFISYQLNNSHHRYGTQEILNIFLFYLEL